MGNYIGKDSPKVANLFNNERSFIVERFLVPNCDFLKPRFGEANIVVGICGKGRDMENPLSHQGIRLGDSEIYQMSNCIEGKDSLSYEFGPGENKEKVYLNVFKRDKEVCYHLKAGEIDITRTMDPLIAKTFKTIGMNSAELDKLKNILQ